MLRKVLFEKNTEGVYLTHLFDYQWAKRFIFIKKKSITKKQYICSLKGDITLIPKPGVGHHPHGLEDSTPIIEFIDKHSKPK